MKSHINNYIAEKLTEVYTAEGKLPRDHVEYGPMVADGYYTSIEYLFWDPANFFFTSTNGVHDFSNPIDYNKALQDIWEYLDKETQNTIMAEVLGRKQDE